MSDLLFADLKKEYDAGHIVAIVGSGVSMAATNGSAAASWNGLIRTGIDRCLAVGVADEDWKARRLEDLAAGDLDELLSACELITRKLGGRGNGEYAKWLADTVGQLPSAVTSRDLLDSVARLNVPLVTTNYDGLLEQSTGLEAVTWQDESLIDEQLRGKGHFVVHIHGFWRKPSSVILGMRSYDDILRDRAAQGSLRALFATRTLLFIGTGVAGGLSDPNFGAFREWITNVYASSTTRHYVLVTDQETASARGHLPLAGRIVPVGYGTTHDDLPIFLDRLSSVSCAQRRQTSLSRVNNADLEEYLASVRRYCCHLPNKQTRIGGGDRCAFDQIYVTASLRRAPRPTESCATVPVPPEPTLTISEALKSTESTNHSHVIVFGRPGLGKSTLLRYLALTCWDHPEKIGLSRQHIPLLLRAQSLPGPDSQYIEARLRAANEVIMDRPLPERFLEEWPAVAKGPWLILVDGLDEVSESARDDVANIVFEFVQDNSPESHRCVLASRPLDSEGNSPMLDIASHCEPFEILPMSTHDQAILAEALLGAEYVDFERQMSALRFNGADRTPLLLTLAAQLYKRSHRLPASQVELYEQYINSSLSLMQVRALAGEIDERLSRHGQSRPLLESLALQMTHKTAGFSPEAAAGTLSPAVRELLGVPKAEAKLIAGRFLGAIARRSGLFAEVQDEVRWQHETFREYLAACALARSSRDDMLAAAERFSDDRWRQVVIFLLAKLSRVRGASEDASSSLLDVIMQKPGVKHAPCFTAAAAIAEGAKASPQTRQQVISELKRVAIRGGKLDYCEPVYAKWSRVGSSPTDLLGRLLPDPDAREALVAVVKDPEVLNYQRQNAIRALSTAGAKEELLSVAEDPAVDCAIREAVREAVSLFEARPSRE